MTENEYDILTAPMDLTQRIFKSVAQRKEKTAPTKRGDKGQDATKPLQPEIEKQEYSMEGLEGMKKAELMKLSKRGLTKRNQSHPDSRILDAGPPELPTVDRASMKKSCKLSKI